MNSKNRFLTICLIVLSLVGIGLAGCEGSSTEPAGKNDTPEMKQMRKDKNN